MPVRFLFHFLASVHFAIALILCVLFFVVAGTVIESLTGSHLTAAKFAYHNPIFLALLGAFFLNILLSALKRIPFQKKHIPFLLSHLGLLMIIAGTMVKGIYGVQGVMRLSEGTESNLLWFPHTYSLHLENRKLAYVIPLNYEEKGEIASPFPELKITTLEWFPHGKETFEGWIKQDSLHLLGYPPLPISQEKMPTLPLVLKSPPWHFFAGHLATSLLSPPPQLPAVTVSQDAEGNETVALWNANGEKIQKTFPANQLETLLVFDKGFGGYALFASFPSLELATPLTKRFASLPSPSKKELNQPLLRLQVNAEGKQETITLLYDPNAASLKWPILEGNYLARFQPRLKLIPHTVRLREARTITYAGSSDPFSYECDLEIDNIETTLSMNHVYETLQGYRFYLASVATAEGDTAKKIHLAVNYDPGKKWMTYPGALFLALGMILFFIQINKKGKI